MAFLDKLRLANIFTKDRANDRPFGMPDMNQGDDFLRRVLPLAQSVELGRENRANSVRAADMSLNAQPRPQINRLKQIGDSLGFKNTPQNVRFGGDIKSSPNQQRFEEETNKSRDIDLEDSLFKRDVARKDDLASDKRKQDELAFNRSLMTGSIEDQTAKEIADTGFKRAQETGKTEFERRRQLAQEDDARAAEEARRVASERERLARVTGEESRKTVEARGDIINPSQQGNDFKNRIQNLTIQNPEAAKFIEQDPNTGTFTISSRATPEQKAWIQKYLTGNDSTTKTLTRVNKKDGRKQTSTDGGKTWVEAK